MSLVYFLQGGSLVTYGIAEDAVTSAPVALSDVWPQLSGEFTSGIDAAVNYGDGKAYLFRGAEYVRVDIASGVVETEVRSIGEFWAGMTDIGFDADLDAAVNDGAGRVYFFKGADYCVYDVAGDKVSESGPITSWAFAPDGTFDSDLDAEVNYGNGKLYVFKSDCYVRYDLGAGTDTEVRRTGEFWAGLADAGIGAGDGADLGGSWCAADPAGRSAVTPTPGPGPVTGSADPQALTGGADVNAYFQAQSGMDFIDWFNAHHANQGAFAPTANRRFQMATDADTRARFVQWWDMIGTTFGTATIRIDQFIALQTIHVNELGGTMAPVAERFGMPGHAGIAYCFDAVQGVKSSYNSGAAPRKTALDCFNDQGFLDAHAALPFAAELAHTTDAVWGGTVYPADRYPTGIVEAGIIAQADFCKFRGRGMIQTTWREGYLGIIDFVLSYTGSNQVVLDAQQRWSGLTRDQVAFASSNDDWDRLFLHSDYLVPAMGAQLHSRMKGGYLDVSTDPATRDGKGKGSFYAVGAGIGWPAYGELFMKRAKQVRDSLP